MEGNRPRAGDVRRVSRKSKSVHVSNLHLPPERDERTLSRFVRWQIDRPYLSTAPFVVLGSCVCFTLRWYMGSSLVNSLIWSVGSGVGMALAILSSARNQRRLYRRPYRRDA
jgi:hypothetical protein